MDKKKQLSNVAFGGNWSEEILTNDELYAVLDVIALAAAECMSRDVEDEALLNAMLFIRKNIEKGPMLCAAFFKAIRIENQALRYREVGKVEDMIRQWAGVE
jgi:hypothetical protein